jgi:hypothetical protein
MGLNKLNHIYEEPFILNTLRVDNDVAIADQLSVSAVIETLSIKNLIVTENLTAGVTNISGDDQNNIKVGENAHLLQMVFKIPHLVETLYSQLTLALTTLLLEIQH